MVVVFHAPFSSETVRMIIKVAFIVAQLFIVNLMTAVYLMHQALA